ncbi:MAG: LolA family protein [Candidatus Binatia bacterium]
MFLVFLGVLFCPGGFLTEAGESKDAESILENLQKRYDSTLDFVADFEQETEVSTVRRNLKARGKVYFKRPGKMLWRYDEPKGQLILADGKHLYYYQPEQGQVIKSALNNAFRSDIPLSFLLGIGNIKRDFKAVLRGTEEGNYVLQLGPKGELEGVNELHLGVDRDEFDIRWARIRDAVGNTTTVRFAHMRRGVGLKDSLFRFTVPDGVDVVEFGPQSVP